MQGKTDIKTKSTGQGYLYRVQFQGVALKQQSVLDNRLTKLVERLFIIFSGHKSGFTPWFVDNTIKTAVFQRNTHVLVYTHKKQVSDRGFEKRLYAMWQAFSLISKRNM